MTIGKKILPPAVDSVLAEATPTARKVAMTTVLVDGGAAGEAAVGEAAGAAAATMEAVTTMMAKEVAAAMAEAGEVDAVDEGVGMMMTAVDDPTAGAGTMTAMTRKVVATEAEGRTETMEDAAAMVMKREKRERKNPNQ